MEQRKLRMHEDLLYSVIQRQAGTLGKAVLEGVMNSIDADAKECAVTLDNNVLTIKDDGKGFAGIAEVDKFFEVFGQPHAEEEHKTYGTFRMGRGQLFAFGHNVWHSGRMAMDVDIKARGLDYFRGETDKEPVKGCHIRVELYKRLLPSELIEVRNEIKKLIRYVPITVTMNGELVSVDPSKQKWDHDTPDAWIKLRETGDLEVYNLGVYVKGYSNHTFGSGGTVVSKKQLKVNFARNDVMVSECPVWKRIRKFVNAKATDANTRKETLNDGSRARLAEQVAAGELDDAQAINLKLLTDVSGRHWSIMQFFGNCPYRYGEKMTVCDRGSAGKGDAVHQAKLAFVMSAETVEIFGCGNGKNLLSLIRKVYDRNNRYMSHSEWKFIPFEKIADKFDESHVMVPKDEWTPKEAAVLHAVESESWRICNTLDGSYGYGKNRKLVLGQSGTADGWTDGSTFIALNRKWLGARMDMGMKECTDIAALMLHEYCHDCSDAGSHVHSPEFYQKFHDAVTQGAISCCVDTLFKRISMDLERAGFVLSKKAVKIKDKIIQNSESSGKLAAAEQKIAALQKPKAEKAEAKVGPKPAAKGGSPYRGKYGTLFDAAQEWIEPGMLFINVAAKTGQSPEQVRMAFNVLAKPEHRSNGGKSEKVVRADGLVKLVAK
jgi:hypothetical protein